jgi:hypothetical protein
MTDVKTAFAQYYKAERNRSEACLDDIIKIMQMPDIGEGEQLNQILSRMIRHYKREDAA